MESIYSRGVPFGSLNSPDIKNSKWGTPNLKKIWGSGNSFFSSYPMQKNSLSLMVKLFFKYEQKLRQYHQKTPCMSSSWTIENDFHQKTAFAAWPSCTDARLQPSSLVLVYFWVFLCVFLLQPVFSLGFLLSHFCSCIDMTHDIDVGFQSVCPSVCYIVIVYVNKCTCCQPFSASDRSIILVLWAQSAFKIPGEPRQQRYKMHRDSKNLYFHPLSLLFVETIWDRPIAPTDH